MRRFRNGFGRVCTGLMALVALVPVAAQATKVVVMTPTTVQAALAQVQAGDRLQLVGDFTAQLRISNRDFGGVVVDGRQATLRQGLNLRNVHGLTFTGLNVGTAGVATTARHAVNVENSSHVSFANSSWVGVGGSAGTGLRILNSQFTTVRDSRFDGLLDGLVLSGSSDSLVTRNSFTRGGSDGMKLANNQRAIVSANSCTGFTILPGAHPDCIQMWSIVGQPLQADIYLLNNFVLGNQQGFTSFDPSGRTADRVTFAGNYVAVDRPHGMFCGGCSNSRFEDNVVVTLPHARFVSMLRVTNAQNSIMQNNFHYDLRGMQAPLDSLLPARIWSTLVPSIAGQVGSNFDERSWHPTLASALSASGTPEPGSWLLMLVGFLAVGRSLRQQRAVRLQQVAA